jgi:hypothetical protein
MRNLTSGASMRCSAEQTRSRFGIGVQCAGCKPATEECIHLSIGPRYNSRVRRFTVNFTLAVQLRLEAINFWGNLFVRNAFGGRACVYHVDWRALLLLPCCRQTSCTLAKTLPFCSQLLMCFRQVLPESYMCMRDCGAGFCYVPAVHRQRHVWFACLVLQSASL